MIVMLNIKQQRLEINSVSTHNISNNSSKNGQVWNTVIYYAALQIVISKSILYKRLNTNIKMIRCVSEVHDCLQSLIGIQM